MLIAHWKAGAKPSQRAWRNKMAVLGPGDADLEWRGVANRLPGYRIWSLNSTSLSITGSGAWIPSDCTEQWRSVRTHTSSRRAYPLHRRVDVCSPASSASFCPGLSSTVPPSSCTSCVSVIFLTSRPSSHIHSSAFPLAQAPGSLLYRQGPYHCSLIGLSVPVFLFLKDCHHCCLSEHGLLHIWWLPIQKRSWNSDNHPGLFTIFSAHFYLTFFLCCQSGLLALKPSPNLLSVSILVCRMGIRIDLNT